MENWKELGHEVNDFGTLAACLEHHLGGTRSRSCRVVGLRRKMGKWIVEFRATEDDADRSYIGKIYWSDRGQRNFDALSRLWEAGFRPPSPFTVVRPIAYVADRRLLLQEKAPGRTVSDILFGGSDGADTLSRTAGWLATLHPTPASDGSSRLEQVRASLTHHGQELMQLIPRHASRLERLVGCALSKLEERQLTPLVSSHGDFHPRNVFVNEAGRVTVIDLDTFGLQERAADVAYFLAQTAIMGYFLLGSFAATAWMRQCFLQAYLDVAPPIPRQRLSLYMAAAFLQSMFYELCILRTTKTSMIEPWLANSERCLLEDEVTLVEGRPEKILSCSPPSEDAGPRVAAAAAPRLIPPYGGKLVDLMIPPAEVDRMKAHAAQLPSVQLSERAACDLELLATGAFSPLDRFMGREDYRRVLGEMRLADGRVFPIPVVLPVDAGPQIRLDREIALRNSKNELLAVMRIEEIFEWDLQEAGQRVFATQDVRHPLVAEMCHWGGLFISGALQVLHLPTHYDFRELRLRPEQTRARLETLGHKNVVAFQTRNPLHRIHEELAARAMRERGAALLLHPVVGLTRPGDVDYVTRVRTYQALVASCEDRSRILLALLPLAMRFAGPREALWHALIRRNYGANFLIIGRDHASPGVDSKGRPFYGPYDAQELVERFRDELGVGVVPFRELVYLPDEDRFDEVSRIPENARSVSISGTQLREEYLNKGERPPSWFTRPEIAEILAENYPMRLRQGVCVWFTGLSGAGKTTTAEEVAVLLSERGRQTTILDGDAARTLLCRGLGFSREDRDANILRIGFVAAEIVRHGGAVICATVSPYRATRNLVRNMIGPDRFVEVFVDTPLDVCELRDNKGMYARARRGEIEGFTGIDDPYEPPLVPGLTLDTVSHTPQENARLVLDCLIQRGFVAGPRRPAAGGAQNPRGMAINATLDGKPAAAAVQRGEIPEAADE